MSIYFDFEVRKACFLLQQYLNALDVHFNVRSLYEQAYRKRLGIDYDPTFLLNLEQDPRLQSAKDEPYTTQTIIETLLQFGHEPLVRTLLRETRKLNIGFTQAYIMGYSRKATDADSYAEPHEEDEP